MTKTFTSVVSNRFKLLGLSVTTPLVRSVRLSLVWDFEFGSLGFVCNLFFGAWNFQILHQTVTYSEVGGRCEYSAPIAVAVLLLDSQKTFSYSRIFK